MSTGNYLLGRLKSIGNPYGVGGGHSCHCLVGVHPLDRRCLVRQLNGSGNRGASEYKGDDPPLHVLVDPGKWADVYGDSRFLSYLTLRSLLEGLVEFENAAGGFPVTVVTSPDHEHVARSVHDDAGHGQ